MEWQVVELTPMISLPSSTFRWPISSGEAHQEIYGLELSKTQNLNLTIFGEEHQITLKCNCHYNEDEETELSSFFHDKLHLDEQHEDKVIEKLKQENYPAVRTLKEEFVDSSSSFKRKQEAEGEFLDSFVSQKKLSSNNKLFVGKHTQVIIHSVSVNPTSFPYSLKEFPWTIELKESLKENNNNKRILLIGESGSKKRSFLTLAMKETNLTPFWLTPEDIYLGLNTNPSRKLSDLIRAVQIIRNSCLVIDQMDLLFHSQEDDFWEFSLQFLIELEKNPDMLIIGICTDENRIFKNILFDHFQTRKIYFHSPNGVSEWKSFWNNRGIDNMDVIANSTCLTLSEAISCFNNNQFEMERFDELKISGKDRLLLVGELPFTYISAATTSIIRVNDFEIVNQCFNQVAGQQEAKQVLIEALIWPQIKNLEKFNISPIRGVILYGPPGTGKTLLAKCAAEASNSNFLSISVSDLIRGDVGSSEKRVSRLFELAKSCPKPCILFFDEASALFTNRNQLGPAGQKVVSQFLLEIDSLQKNDGIVLLAATNDLHLMDAAMIRPGRFDRKVYVGALFTMEERFVVIENTIKNRQERFSELNLRQVASMMPNHLTGANVMQIILRAEMEADQREEYSSKVNLSDIEVALREELKE